MAYQQILDRVCESYQQILGENLRGIYVHGSIAFGCFDPRVSDIDFLVVTAQKPTHEQKTQMIGELLKLDAYAPPKGFEMSLVLEQYCRCFVYPTPYELHFSNAYRQQASEDPDAYCRMMNGTDPDLAAHFTVTRCVGQTLFGVPAGQMFGEVAHEAYLHSLRLDVENAMEDVKTNPVYVILNLCRITAYLREGKVLSKKDGGLWGLDHLSERYHAVISAALHSYTGAEAFQADKKLQQNFVQERISEIFSA